jgi:hypothetical protein
MNEHLFQYIWLHRLYDAHQLMTEDHQSVFIIHQGIHNTDQGPDFLHARIRLNDIELCGSVELHIKTSDWYQHGHTGDDHYKNVILHVVWDHNVAFDLPIPVISLHGRVSSVLLQHYSMMMTKDNRIPCAAHLNKTDRLIIDQWKERMLAERLTYKVSMICTIADKSKQYDEEIFWLLIFRNMGMPVNADALEAIYRSVPFKVWMQCRMRIQVMEALLLGQANLLAGEPEEDYIIMLQNEYRHIKRKYDLRSQHLLISNLRMRPAHFPLMRMVQLAMLWHMHPDLHTYMMHADSVDDMRKKLMVSTNDFWQNHYSLSAPSQRREKQLGHTMADLLLINTILPFRYYKVMQSKNETEKEKVIDLYHEIPAEHNAIIRRWKSLGVAAHKAADSQGLLHLYKHYCESKRCLECAIGTSIIRS